VNLRTRLREEMATEPNDEEVASAANACIPYEAIEGYGEFANETERRDGY
jgi:hypothetical protein